MTIIFVLESTDKKLTGKSAALTLHPFLIIGGASDIRLYLLGAYFALLIRCVISRKASNARRKTRDSVNQSFHRAHIFVFYQLHLFDGMRHISSRFAPFSLTFCAVFFLVTYLLNRTTPNTIETLHVMISFMQATLRRE